MNQWKNGWMDGWIDGWMGGWMDQSIDRSVESMASPTESQFVGVTTASSMSPNGVSVSDLSDNSIARLLAWFSGWRVD